MRNPHSPHPATLANFFTIQVFCTASVIAAAMKALFYERRVFDAASHLEYLLCFRPMRWRKQLTISSARKRVQFQVWMSSLAFLKADFGLLRGSALSIMLRNWLVHMYLVRRIFMCISDGQENKMCVGGHSVTHPDPDVSGQMRLLLIFPSGCRWWRSCDSKCATEEEGSQRRRTQWGRGRINNRGE